jgi:outer membrane receptor protein involved in Fe transport
MRAAAALADLLAPSGLDYEQIGDTVTVPGRSTVKSSTRLSVDTVSHISEISNVDNTALDAEKPPEGGASRVSNSDRGKANNVAEIIVTAEKRNERLQDVPVPVTAISAATLADSDQLLLRDYATLIPGLSVTPGASAGGEQLITIRGITTGFNTTPTVGVLVDDVPYTSSVNVTGNNLPDIDPSDLDHIEVLRGPQGTLYGASSMGGLIKFVTAEPSPSAYSARIQVGTMSIHNGSKLGYTFRASTNLPITDGLAVRLSAFDREDPGYINNIVTHADGVNKANAYGGHFAMLWKPIEEFSWKLSALYQQTKSDGENDVEFGPGLGDLQQTNIVGTGWYFTSVQAYSSVIKAKLGSLDVTSVTGYNVNTLSNSLDLSNVFGFVQQIFDVSGAPLITHNKNNKFSQELRASSSIGKLFDWTIGGFYTYESDPYVQNIPATNADTGEIVGEIYFNKGGTYRFSEYAGFTNVTWHIVEPFDLQIGARESKLSAKNLESVDEGIFYGPDGAFNPELSSDSTAFTYSATPRLKISPNVMIYGRLASGYQAGGPNGFNPDPLVQRKYQPSKTENYELGTKEDLLDHRLSLDASVYYIRWKDTQINLADPSNGLSYTTNGGRAKSHGVELSVDIRPVEGLRLGAWVTWGEATVTEDFPPAASVQARAGDRLPFSTRFTGNASVDEAFPLKDGISGSVGASVSYVGQRYGGFLPSDLGLRQRQYYPPYALTNAHASLTIDSWRMDLFANNVTDKRVVLQGGLDSYGPNTIVTPRTVGLNISKRL